MLKNEWLESSELAGLKELLAEAESQRFPDTEVVSSLREAVDIAEKCRMMAEKLMSSKVRTRTRLQGEAKCRITLDDLEIFVQQLQQLPCKLPETPSICGTLASLFHPSYVTISWYLLTKKIYFEIYQLFSDVWRLIIRTFLFASINVVCSFMFLLKLINTFPFITVLLQIDILLLEINLHFSIGYYLISMNLLIE